MIVALVIVGVAVLAGVVAFKLSQKGNAVTAGSVAASVVSVATPEKDKLKNDIEKPVGGKLP